MNMHKTRLLCSGLLISLLAGCASYTVEPYRSVRELPDMYLRGVFTWWEADPKYQLKLKQGSVYATSIELIADGQPYDFKFADANWTPGSSCGYKKKFRDQFITLDKVVLADCDRTDENFKFVPKETGLYEFSIDFTKLENPLVKIRKL
jgi:hypothetical protein